MLQAIYKLEDLWFLPMNKIKIFRKRKQKKAATYIYQDIADADNKSEDNYAITSRNAVSNKQTCLIA